MTDNFVIDDVMKGVRDTERRVVRGLGDQIGYGNLMSLASEVWEDKLDKERPGTGIAAFAVGPCKAFTVPCGCENLKGCDWCCGAGWLTEHVKAVKDAQQARRDISGLNIADRATAKIQDYIRDDLAGDSQFWYCCACDREAGKPDEILHADDCWIGILVAMKAEMDNALDFIYKIGYRSTYDEINKRKAEAEKGRQLNDEAGIANELEHIHRYTLSHQLDGSHLLTCSGVLLQGEGKEDIPCQDTMTIGQMNNLLSSLEGFRTRMMEDANERSDLIKGMGWEAEAAGCYTSGFLIDKLSAIHQEREVLLDLCISVHALIAVAISKYESLPDDLRIKIKDASEGDTSKTFAGPGDSDVMQNDMRHLMTILGISTHARPTSPHKVFVSEIIPMVNQLMSNLQAMGGIVMPGVELIAVERKRQIEYEGWTAKHDDSHQSEELVKAAICYLTHIIDPTFIGKILHKYWPFDTRWWKPKDRKRNLIRAGALIAAELDRLMRLDEAEQS